MAKDIIEILHRVHQAASGENGDPKHQTGVRILDVVVRQLHAEGLLPTSVRRHENIEENQRLTAITRDRYKGDYQLEKDLGRRLSPEELANIGSTLRLWRHASGLSAQQVAVEILGAPNNPEEQKRVNTFKTYLTRYEEGDCRVS